MNELEEAEIKRQLLLRDSKASLCRMQWQAAQSGSIPMMIFLGKNLLDQRDKVEDQPVDLGPLSWTD